MLPEPLHPAIVHFPIVLAVLLPIFAVGALWAIRRNARSRLAWAIPLAVAVALFASAWAALETGEAQEERVEEVVPEQALHAHEEAGERFLVLTGILVVVMAGGLLRGTPGAAARLVGTAGAIGLVVAAVQVGDAGGKLVYEHGAAAAYVSAPTAAQGSASPPSATSPGDREAAGDDD